MEWDAIAPTTKTHSAKTNNIKKKKKKKKKIQVTQLNFATALENLTKSTYKLSIKALDYSIL